MCDRPAAEQSRREHNHSVAQKANPVGGEQKIDDRGPPTDDCGDEAEIDPKKGEDTGQVNKDGCLAPTAETAIKRI